MNFLQDVKFGIRMLFKNLGFTAVSVLTLALGIGACAAIFSLVNALLIQPLPYADPDRVILVLGWDVQNDSLTRSHVRDRRGFTLIESMAPSASWRR